MTLIRRGRRRVTQFDIMGATPDVWFGVPAFGDRGIRIQRLIFDVPRGSTPSLRDIEYLIVAAQDAPTQLVDWMSVFSTGSLQVASFSGEPVAAIGPPENVPVTLDFTAPVARPDDRTLKLEVPYAPKDAPPGKGGANGVPMVDVLGPDIVLWASADRVPASMSTTTHTAPPFDIARNGHINRYYAFEGNVHTEPALHGQLPGTVSWQVLHITRGSFATRIVAGVPGPGDQPRTATDPIAEPGELDVSVPRAVSSASALIPIFRKAQRSPIVRLNHIPFKTSRALAAHTTRKYQRWFPLPDYFQLPPTPPTSGVNVFGTLSALDMQEATGDLSLGNHIQMSLKAPTPLSLKDMSGRGLVGARAVIPVRVDANTARVMVQGQASVDVNGEPVERKTSWIRQVLSPNAVALIATLAAALFAGIALVEARR